LNNKNFENLLEEYSSAYMSQQWDALEQIGQRIGLLIGSEFSGTVRDIHEISKAYLGSIIGPGDFLTKSDPELENKFRRSLTFIENYSDGSNIEIKTSLTPLVKSGYEIQLFLTKKQSDTRNKAASALRKLGRPDLAIILTTQQLEITRLNYYSLVIRSAAYSDLSDFSRAIADGEKALKFSPSEKKNFVLVSLARAYINRFKQTGEIGDSEMAFELAERSFKLKPDDYSANIFLKVIFTIGLLGMEDLITNLQNVKKTHHYQLDQKAIEIAKEVLRNSPLRPITAVIPESDDLLADELFDNWLGLENHDDFDSDNEDVDHPEDYFEDYFEEYLDSLNDPQNPHLEP
jgi:tetratricopeptide (TPR) repeat protein